MVLFRPSPSLVLVLTHMPLVTHNSICFFLVCDKLRVGLNFMDFITSTTENILNINIICIFHNVQGEYSNV